MTMTVRYLGQAAIARQLGVTRHLVGTWRSRYRDTSTPFPGPDAWTGDGEDDDKAVPGWLPERMDEIRAWKASLPGQGAGSSRPRKNRG